jgi:hypothetical protein
MLSASSAVTARPESSRSIALPVPTMRGSIHDVPNSATSPRRVNAVASFTPAAANRRSATSACTSPMPAHPPLIAASSGLRRQRA